MMTEFECVDELTPIDEDQRELVSMIQDFASREIDSVVGQSNRDEEFPKDLLLQMGALGLMGGVIPIEEGGMGLDYVTYSVVIEEMAKYDHIAAAYMSLPSGLCGAGLRVYGNPDQKMKWLRPLAQGKMFAAGGVTEPRSGSDVAGMTTRYRREGNEFVLNGAKAWISNLDHADFLVTFATSDPALGRKGISAFIIPSSTPGLTYQPYVDKLGFRSIRTGDVYLDEVRVPIENLLGEEGKGFVIAMSQVEAGRLAVASRAIGQAYRALGDTVAYAKERVIFGNALSDFQLTKVKIADMAEGVVTARLLVRSAARLMDRGNRARVALSMAKQHATDVLQAVATEAVQIFGAAGTSADHRVAMIYRDAKVFQLVEGANEIHRLLIGDYVLGNRK